MKKAIFFLLLPLLLFIGCAESPVSSNTPENDNNYSLVKLPPKSGLSVETVFTKTELIDGSVGGQIKIKEFYWTDHGKKVKIDAKLTIPKGAFSGSVNITMKIDDDYAAASFEPSMAFDKPLEFDFTVNGLDLSEIGFEPGSYDFVYIADDGSTETVLNNGIVVDELLKGLTVKKAQLNHFSRYAFSR